MKYILKFSSWRGNIAQGFTYLCLYHYISHDYEGLFASVYQIYTQMYTHNNYCWIQKMCFEYAIPFNNLIITGQAFIRVQYLFCLIWNFCNNTLRSELKLSLTKIILLEVPEIKGCLRQLASHYSCSKMYMPLSSRQ